MNQRQSVHPLVFRAGWRAALSGWGRDFCHYPEGPERDAWNEGYSDAERERAKDVAAVRRAVRHVEARG